MNIVEAADGTRIAEILPTDSRGEGAENGDIVAAAPELLQALELVVNHFSDRDIFPQVSAADTAELMFAQIAIAKAGGESRLNQSPLVQKLQNAAAHVTDEWARENLYLDAANEITQQKRLVTTLVETLGKFEAQMDPSLYVNGDGTIPLCMQTAIARLRKEAHAAIAKAEGGE